MNTSPIQGWRDQGAAEEARIAHLSLPAVSDTAASISGLDCPSPFIPSDDDGRQAADSPAYPNGARATIIRGLDEGREITIESYDGLGWYTVRFGDSTATVHHAYDIRIAPDAPPTLRCSACGRTKHTSFFTRIQMNDDYIVCDACITRDERAMLAPPTDPREWATAGIKRAVMAEIARETTMRACAACGDPHARLADDPLPFLCEACQEAGEPWPATLVIGQVVCITSEEHFGRHARIWALDGDTAAWVEWDIAGPLGCDMAYVALACLDPVRCLICDADTHPSWHCPEVAAERLRQEHEESAGRGVARAMRDDRARFLRTVARCGKSDRQAMACALAGYLAARTDLFRIPPMTPERIIAHWSDLLAEFAAQTEVGA